MPGRLGEWQEGNVIGVSERREKVVRNDTSMPTGIRLTDDSNIVGFWFTSPRMGNRWRRTVTRPDLILRELICCFVKTR